jgi:hypothetical protein
MVILRPILALPENMTRLDNVVGLTSRDLPPNVRLKIARPVPALVGNMVRTKD